MGSEIEQCIFGVDITQYVRDKGSKSASAPTMVINRLGKACVWLYRCAKKCLPALHIYANANASILWVQR